MGFLKKLFSLVKKEEKFVAPQETVLPDHSSMSEPELDLEVESTSEVKTDMPVAESTDDSSQR